MANKRIATLMVVALSTGLLRLGWSGETVSPLALGSMGLDSHEVSVSALQAPRALSNATLPASVPGISVVPAQDGVPSAAAVSETSIARLSRGAAQMVHAAAQGGSAPGDVSRKFFDASRSAGDSGDMPDDALRGAKDAPGPLDYPDKAYYAVIPEVAFPGVTRVFDVNTGHEEGVRQLHHLSGGLVIAVTERPVGEGGTARGHFPIGTLARMQILQDGDKLHVAYTGIAEAQIHEYLQDHRVAVKYLLMKPGDQRTESFYMRKITRVITQLGGQEMGLKKSEEFDEHSLETTNRMLAQLDLGHHDNQELLASMSLVDRLSAVARAYSDFIKEQHGEDPGPETPEQEALDQKIEHSTRESAEKAQKEWYLREKRKVIDKELNEGEEGDPSLKEVEKKFAEKKAKMPKKAVEAVERELRRAHRMQAASQEYQVVIGYLEWLTDMPWGVMTTDNNDLKNAQKILDDDHYGINDVKERVIEFLAVRKALAKQKADEADEHKGTIMAFDGPPGVGKTSIGMSIAKALGRKFIRVSLAGMHDEAEMRGHRRTYVGAMPGRIIQAMKEAGVNNPVVLLDEIDKVGSNAGEPGRRGNAENALVELLDPAQNKTWHDNYLDVDYDLSNVLFIGTSNELRNLSQPVLDRLEIIPFSSYIEEEKLEIAKRHLVRKQLNDNGFAPGEVAFSDDAILKIVRQYTHEAGVRQLERTIGKILRKIQTDKELEKGDVSKVGADDIVKYLGQPHHVDDHFKNGVGVASGLYWSAGGGGVLMIEAGQTPKGSTGQHFDVTGNLKEIMQESSRVALKDAINLAKARGVSEKVFTSYDFDIHVPEGATPKDGPSAGITMTTALVSLFTGRAVKQGFAMTGEISRTGRVMPIGGLKEKSLGALRMGYTDIIICKANEKDLEQIPESARKQLRFHSVETIDQVLDIVLEKEGKPLEPIAEPTKAAQ